MTYSRYIRDNDTGRPPVDPYRGPTVTPEFPQGVNGYYAGKVTTKLVAQLPEAEQIIDIPSVISGDADTLGVE